MLKWVGLGLAIIGGITAVIAGAGNHWEMAIIGGIVFVIGMFALIKG
jgi:hypothetical protein